ncbi:MAG: protein-methionine-sulfoxide reductase heme-binding subunit MsrQ [Pseudomonadota bacterium]
MNIPAVREKELVIVKTSVFLLAALPFAQFWWRAYAHTLGPNPVEAALHESGDWALRFLLITLALPLVRRVFAVAWVLRVRRMLGLFAFFYAVVHVSVYLGIDRFFDWDEIAKDILKRPYITLGLGVFLALIPLAVTSTNGMMRRLGPRWKQLHRSVYVIATLAILHYLLSLKADVRVPLIHASILLALLITRAYIQRREAV